MDQHLFDGLTRLLGARAARRDGLRAVLGPALGLATAGAATNAPAASRPRAEGPCGDGSRKQNTCSTDKNCCTGICDTSKGKTNRDRKGRCRCVRKGDPCSEDRNCCSRGNQAMSCESGVCTPLPRIPTGQSCVPGVDRCADKHASCTTYETDAQAVLHAPAGTWCLLPTGAKGCGQPAYGSMACAGAYCAPGARPGAPSICGGPEIVDACTSTTDSGASATIYVLAVPSYTAQTTLFCGLSEVAATPLIYIIQGSGAACTSDDECNLVPPPGAPAGSVCLRNSSLSSLYSLTTGSPTGGFCANGAFVCTTPADCPTFVDPNLTGCTQPTGALTTICSYQDN